MAKFKVVTTEDKLLEALHLSIVECCDRGLSVHNAVLALQTVVMDEYKLYVPYDTVAKLVTAEYRKRAH